jgi:hypothetical protein
VKSIPSRVAMATVVISTILTWYARPGQGQRVAATQQHTPLEATRIYTGSDGLTHVEQVSVKFPPDATAQKAVAHSEPVKVTSSYIVRAAPGAFEDWHNADARRYVIPISGRAEIEIAGGQKIAIDPGRIFIAEDLTGKGHTFRVVGRDEWVALFVQFDQ